LEPMYYLPGPLPIQAQWNIGSFAMERREFSNDNSVSASPWRSCTVGSCSAGRML